MNWREELVRIRNTDLARLNHHLADLSITESDYRTLLNQYYTLKQRYQALLTEKIVSERQIDQFTVSTGDFLMLVNKEKEELANQLRYKRDTQNTVELRNKVQQESMRSQAADINQLVQKNTYQTSLNKSLKFEHQEKASQWTQLHTAVSSLSTRKTQTSESAINQKHLLDEMSNELNILQKYSTGITLELGSLQELNQNLNDRISNLLSKQNLTDLKIDGVKKDVHELIDKVRARQNRLQDMKLRVRGTIDAREKQIAKGKNLTRCINDAQDRLSAKQSLLSALNRQINALKSDNEAISQDSQKLVSFVTKSNIHIDNLTECTAQLMAEVEDCLEQDVRVKIILDRKYEGYRDLLNRFRRSQPTKSAVVYERTKELADSRTTTGTVDSRIKRYG